MFAIALLIQVARPAIETRLALALHDVTRFDHSFHAVLGRTLSQNSFRLRTILKPDGAENIRLIVADDGDEAAFTDGKTFVAWISKDHVRVQGLWQESEDSAQNSLDQPTAYHVSGNRLVIAGALEDDTNAPCPAIQIWTMKNDRWAETVLVVGAAEAAAPDPHFLKSEFDKLTFSTRPYPRDLSVAHAGPHLLETSTFAVKGNALTLIAHRLENTALAALSDVVTAVRKNNRALFNRHVPERFRRELWRMIESEKDFGASNKSSVANDMADSFLIGPAGSEDRTIRFRKSSRRWIVVSLVR